MPLYLLSPRALRDLKEIRQYLSAAPEPIRIREIGKLEAAFDQAVQFPRSGRLEPAFRSDGSEVRSLLRYPYRIYYLPQAVPLKIAAIRHGRQEPLRTGTVM